MWYVLENKESNRGISREVDGEWGSGEVINTLDGRLYHKATIGGREKYNISSI